MPRRYNEKRLTFNDVSCAAEQFSNWGKWGPDDEIGTLNFVEPKDIVNASKLIQRGKLFSLALNFDRNGPQRGLWGNRFNPIHVMLITGTDAMSDRRSGEDIPEGDGGPIRYSDDMVSMPLQCGTQWDGLSHIFYRGKMWNGYDARLVDSDGAQRNGIEKVKGKMAGRGVLLDVARYLGQEYLEDGTAITMADLDATAATQEIEIRRGDFVIVRTGQMEQRLKAGEWGGYAGGEAPGLAFETCEWIYNKQIAAICTDTWGCEVRPPETVDVESPWHWVVIPKIGISMGEMFYLKELADDCAEDGVYQFFFTAPPLPITKAVGSPINPMAIK